MPSRNDRKLRKRPAKLDPTKNRSTRGRKPIGSKEIVLTDMQLAALNLLKDPSVTPTDVAIQLGVSERTVRNWADTYRDHLLDIEYFKTEFLTVVVLAIRTIKAALSGQTKVSSNLRLKTALQIAEAIGWIKPSRTINVGVLINQHKTTNVQAGDINVNAPRDENVGSDDDILDALQRALEIAGRSPEGPEQAEEVGP